MCVGIGSSESSTFALQLAYGKAVIVDCSPAGLVLGAATKREPQINKARFLELWK